MIHALLVSALLLTQAAPAERPCITPQEAGDMAVALLPSLVDAATQRCRPHLAGDAFLLTGAVQWSAQLRRDAGPRRESAMRGIALISGSTAPPAAADNEATFEFVAAMLAGVLARDIDPASCSDLDTIARSLAPLPSDNIAQLVGATLGLAMAHESDDDEDDRDADTDLDDDDDNDDDDDDEAEEARDGPPICRTPSPSATAAGQ
jgi:hypothetical protein